jgi:hypothetical protein
VYRAIKVFLETGSHFLANAERGYPNDDHRAVLVVEVNSKEEALQIVPPMYRDVAKITEMATFTRDDMDELKNLFHIAGDLYHKHDH